MVPLENIATFVAFGLVIVAIPGPSVMFAISRALVLGKRGGLLTVTGNAIGVMTQAVAVSIGLGVLIQNNDLLMHSIRLAGAAFLIYLGVQSIRHRREGLDLSAPAEPPSSRHILRQSIIVGLSNPKTIVFFTAAFPQFVDPAAGPIVWQMLELSAIFLVIGFSGDALYAVGAGIAREWFARSPERVVVIRTIGGSMITALGVLTAVLPN